MFGKKPLLPTLLLVFVFVTTVLITVISGQGGVGDIRNRAAEGPYPTATPSNFLNCESYTHEISCENEWNDVYLCGWNNETNTCSTYWANCDKITDSSECNAYTSNGVKCIWSNELNSCFSINTIPTLTPTPTIANPAPGSYCQTPDDVINYNCRNCQYGYEILTTCVNNYCGKCLIGWSTPTQIPPTVTPTRIIPTNTLIVPSATPTRIIPTNSPISFVTNTPRPTPSPTPSGKSSGFYCLFFPNAPQCKK